MSIQVNHQLGLQQDSLDRWLYSRSELIATADTPKLFPNLFCRRDGKYYIEIWHPRTQDQHIFVLENKTDLQVLEIFNQIAMFNYQTCEGQLPAAVADFLFPRCREFAKAQYDVINKTCYLKCRELELPEGSIDNITRYIIDDITCYS